MPTVDVDQCNALANLAAKIPNWFSTTIIYKVWKLGRLEITFRMRRKDGIMGRFGGGWNWIIGLEIGGQTILCNLLVATLIFHMSEKNR